MGRYDLDIYTLKGQRTLRQEQFMLDRLESLYPELSFIETPKDVPAGVDGVIVRDMVLLAVYESKCRTLTLEEMYRFKTWFTDWQKLEGGRSASELLGVPFGAFVYLVKEGVVLWFQITNSAGEYVVPIKRTTQRTQASVNGGRKWRETGHISVSEATLIEIN